MYLPAIRGTDGHNRQRESFQMRSILALAVAASLGLALGGCMTDEQRLAATPQQKAADASCTQSHTTGSVIGAVLGGPGFLLGNVVAHAADSNCAVEKPTDAQIAEYKTKHKPAKKVWKNPDADRG